MRLNRRSVLYFLTGVGGWPRAAWSTGSYRTERNAEAQDAGWPAERVLGIGGLFFRARDPKALAEWYRSHLGVTPTPTSMGDKSWHTEAGTTVFAPFSLTTKYLGDERQMWMVNFRVRDLEKMAAQLRAGGVEVKVDSERSPIGRFARIHDPEGNPIELWEPAGRDASAE